MDSLAGTVGPVLNREIPRKARLVVGLSGGIDSVVLLHLLVRGLQIAPSRLTAVHVNHQLSPHAADWAAFCRRLCRSLGVKLQVARVDVQRGNSTEAAARTLRYGVFAASGADAVLLAHNRDDQAETLLLQLLRGAGPRGLAAMPLMRAAGAGMPPVLRPLLDVPRKTIAAYARRHGLQWVEDESNADRAYLRNFLRHEVMPVLDRRVPGAGATLARAARHQAEASDLLDVLAAQDIGMRDAGLRQDCLPLASLRLLAPHRARNALRYFLRCWSVVMPDADRLEELLRQALTARGDARVRIVVADVELRRFQDALYVVRRLKPAGDFEFQWSGRDVLKLPQLGGTLRLVPGKNGGIAKSILRSAVLTVRNRCGGESLRLSPRGRLRTVRNLLQEAAMPPWQRERLPFLYLNGELAAVPGLGVDARFRGVNAASGLQPLWSPE